jgi:hypothetical protein
MLVWESIVRPFLDKVELDESLLNGDLEVSLNIDFSS